MHAPHCWQNRMVWTPCSWFSHSPSSCSPSLLSAFLFFFSLPQQCHWSCILQAHISYQKHPAAGHSETRAGCQIPGRQLGSAGILMWQRWKLLAALPASPSLSVSDKYLGWGIVTVKIANCNNKSFHQMFCTTLRNFPFNCRNLFNGVFFDQCVGWAPVIAVPKTAWLKRRLLCCQTIFLSLLCSGSSVSASNFCSWFSFLLLWGQLFLCMQCSSNSCQLSGSSQHFQRVLTFICFFCVCAHCERDVWASDLPDRKCHEEVKMGSRQRTGLRICLGPLIRACRVHSIFSGASHPSLSLQKQLKHS